MLRNASQIFGKIVVGLVLLFWTLLPLMQHEIDRTWQFWLFWFAGEVALVVCLIKCFRWSPTASAPDEGTSWHAHVIPINAAEYKLLGNTS